MLYNLVGSVMEISGKTAVIIGGARGLGKAIVQALLDKGARVFVGDVLVEEGQRTVRELSSTHGSDKVEFRKCDITSIEDIKALFDAATEKWSYVDIFSPVAGIVAECRWRDVIAVNLVGTIQSAEEAMRRMGKDQGGHGGAVVFFCSKAGVRPFPFGPVYTATKHGMVGYMRAYAHDLHASRHGIHLTCLCPGSAKSVMVDLDLMPKGSYLMEDHLRASYDEANCMKATSVAAGFLRCVEDATLHGKALIVERKDGQDLSEVAEFPYS